jgi:hypothetical protein
MVKVYPHRLRLGQFLRTVPSCALLLNFLLAAAKKHVLWGPTELPQSLLDSVGRDKKSTELHARRSTTYGIYDEARGKRGPLKEKCGLLQPKPHDYQKPTQLAKDCQISTQLKSRLAAALI